MCLVLLGDKTLHTAEEDVPVWKILRKKLVKGEQMLTALYWDFIYTVGEQTPHVDIKAVGALERIVEKGYHGFIKEEDATKYYNALKRFHTGYGDIELYEAIIPKGSKFFIGEQVQHGKDDGFAATSLMITRQVKA